MASLISSQIFQTNNNSSSVEDNNKSIGRKGARRLRLIFVKEVQKHKEDLFGKYSSLTHGFTIPSYINQVLTSS